MIRDGVARLGSRSAALFLWAALLAAVGSAAAQRVVGKRQPHQVTLGEAEEPAFTVYEEMSYRGMTVRVLPNPSGPADRPSAYLRVHEEGGPQFLNRSYLLTKEAPTDKGASPYVVVPELEGLPALVADLNKSSPYEITFAVDKPARMYAYVLWAWSDAENPERELWHYYRIDSAAAASVYYRDFQAGTHTLRFVAAPFVGVGLSPLETLPPAEKIVPVALVRDDQPVLQIRSEYEAVRSLRLRFEARNPVDDSVERVGEMTVTAQPQTVTPVPLPLTALKEGVLYFTSLSLTDGETEWKLTMPYGRFPVPPEEPAIQPPIFPYGGYIKLQVNEDPEIYGRFLAATFYHFRKMHMNAAVLAKAQKYRLDLAQKYGIKAVIRLGNKAGQEQAVPDEVVHHPAVLTYMIGDEPKIGESLDAHKELFRSLTAKYPEYKPITCTIYDSYGQGGPTDPVRIYNDHLSEFDLIRFGRYYCFQKSAYGLLHPPSYKCRLEATSVFSGLEADPRPWWLAPQFFGSGEPLAGAYWRVPSGVEMTALLHLAVAHRCTGILGWGVHSHHQWTGLCFDGHTMAPSPGNALNELRAFGAQLARAKPVLQAFTDERLQIHRLRPWEVDAAARKLTDGRFALYVVNRDLEEPHPAELHLFLGDALRAKYGKGEDPAAIRDSITKVVDLYSGQAVPYEFYSEFKDRFGFLKLSLNRLQPGQAALLVVERKAEDEVETTEGDGAEVDRALD